MKFLISPKLIESYKSSSSKYKNNLVEKAKLAEQEAKRKNGPQSKRKTSKEEKEDWMYWGRYKVSGFCSPVEGTYVCGYTLFFYKHQLKIWFSLICAYPNSSALKYA